MSYPGRLFSDGVYISILCVFLTASEVANSPSKPVMPFADDSKIPGSHQFETCLVMQLLS